MSTLLVSIKNFGIFRTFGDSFAIRISTGSSIQQLKDALIQQIGEQHMTLVTESVLANDETILPNHHILEKKSTLSILPPVCGG